ncbi:MAG TPA: sn-glycerol-3-phosphate ABC transporter ATP-binding protein UgpC [bacterium]|nr:sn-glycerol-3-phosphate ABC transporter ATP-binding protein UgpC [bacterium]
MASVTFEKVVKKYSEEAVILKGIDLEVGDGEFLVLVGPSGCGKSTLLRTLAGLETITSGNIRIGERIVNNVAPKDRDIAMVFQSYALYPHMTVRENMSFALKVRNFEKKEIEKRVNAAAELLDITHLLDRLPKQMSGRQRQRVAMGRAIVRDPKVFLFDEPLSNLDASLRTQMRVELKKLHERLKTTIIYVTHDQVEAMTLADRIVVLNKGILQQVGTPAELFDTPANVFVAGFIGSPSMNLLNLKTIKRGDHATLVSDGINIGIVFSEGCFREEMVVGIRPQDFMLTDGDPEISGTVEIVEALGRQSLVHVKLSDTAKIAAELETVLARNFKIGDKIKLNIKHEKMHFFDSVTKERINGEIK